MERCIDWHEEFEVCIHDCNREWRKHRSYEKLQACVKRCVEEMERRMKEVYGYG